MSADQLIDITAGIICGVLCARHYYLTKAARRRLRRYLPRRIRELNRL
jgi:membrane-associated phospholipid phosphatase